ncbi:MULTISPECIES: flavin reductase family protein [unclassified Enterococcus]|uniref:flavin reductase family protein n=1 Tax=unclassified Enterococcus TaxID=2608891 RepID=UPI001A9AB1F7|nr:flavin reductase family protein [Enterococcus sp. DIV1271a]MBO1300723.1 flavin reductase family protein [Enterococcus sp. DIV1271a]
MFKRVPSELTERENYKLLIGSVIPRPVAVVASCSSNGVTNIAPFSYFNIVSSNPPILSLAIQRKNGEWKDTARHLMETKEAVIHVLDENILVDANQTAASLPSEESELTLTSFTVSESDTIDVPRINEASIAFETTLYQHVPIMKDQEITADLFLLQITAYQLSETVYDEQTGYIDPTNLQPISRLAGNDYGKLGEIVSMLRPK